MALVSEEEIEREVRTLRNLRRRSGSSPGPGALPVDPDLPPPSPAASSSADTYSMNDDITLSTPDGLDDGGLFWVPAHLHPELAPGEFRAFLKSHTAADPDAAGGAGELGEAGPGLARTQSWLARSSSRGASALGRKKSMLSRQYQPMAGDRVEDEAPPVPGLGRQRGSIYGGRTGEKGLTLQDLQKLEEMMEDVEDSDPQQMKQALRRSLSMNVAPGFLEETVHGQEADTPIVQRPMSIIRRTARTRTQKLSSPAAGSRRLAATRKARGGAAAADDSVFDESRKSSDNSDEQARDPSSSDGHSPGQSADDHDQRRPYEDRRPSDASGYSEASTDEALIFDAYARDRSSNASELSSASSYDDRAERVSRSPSPEHGYAKPADRPVLAPILTPHASENAWLAPAAEGERTPTQESVRDPLAGVRRPSPGTEGAAAGFTPGPRVDQGAPTLQVPHDAWRAPAMADAPRPAPPEHDLPPGMAPPTARAAVPPGIASQQKPAAPATPERPALARTVSGASAASSVASAASATPRPKDKEKKGGLFSKKDKKDKSGDDKAAKPGKKDKDGFLGSLFGGKKKHDEPSSVSSFGTAGPAAAAALLGTSKSAKSLGVTTPGTASPTSPGFNSYARYPIHVERAVYRLSHIKLANARRPLIEQVLISNLMFWYLGVIGRTTQDEQPKRGAAPNGLDDKRDEQSRTPPPKGTPPRSADTGSAGSRDQSPPPLLRVDTRERERERERDRERERERERQREAERERDREREREREYEAAAAAAAAGPRKNGLSKPERSRSGGSSEAAVRAPQYGMQGAQVDKEMRGGPRQAYPPPAPPAAPHPHAAQHLHPQQHAPPPPPYPQQQRSLSNPTPPPSRALSPPQPPRPAPADFPTRELQAPARGPPQSSFGPPPTQGYAPQAERDRRYDDGLSPRPRTMSHPGPGQPAPPSLGASPGAPAPPHPAGPGMRRVVTDSLTYPAESPRSPTGAHHPPARPMYPQHSGPQPGQIFAYPGMALPGPRSPTSGTQPGQIFTPPAGMQPGQLFHHPSHPQLRQSAQQPQQPQQQPQHWEPPQRLPPGAAPPGSYGPPGGPGQPPHQAYLGQPAPPQRRVSPGPPDGFRPTLPPPGGPGGYPPRPPHGQLPPPHPQQQQAFYARPPQGYRPPQAQPVPGPYHHR